MAEVIRSGILSVEQGQIDASKSLGMSWWQSMYRIILPQSLRVVVPPMGNNFNIMLKILDIFKPNINENQILHFWRNLVCRIYQCQSFLEYPNQVLYAQSSNQFSTSKAS